MKQYAWIMAACLTAAMVSGCGVAQKGEAGNGSESTAASSERSGDAVRRVRKQRTKKVPWQ